MQRSLLTQMCIRDRYDGGKSNYVMIIAHRGNWRNAPENSLQGYNHHIIRLTSIIQLVQDKIYTFVLSYSIQPQKHTYQSYYYFPHF